MAKKIRLCSLSDVKPGKPYSVYVGEKRVAVYIAEGKYYVLDDECLHRGAPLSEGVQDGLSVTCPLHDWTYSLETGSLLDQTGLALRTYKVIIEGNDICVEWPEA